MYSLHSKEQENFAEKELQKKTIKKFGAKSLHWYKDAFFGVQNAFRAFHIKTGDYVLVSALSDPLLVAAILSLNAKPIFIDVKMGDGQLNLDVLEHFLSLATIVNEKDELIYRKDNASIRAIVLDYPLGIHEGAAGLVFTAQRYQLKVFEDFSGALGESNQTGKLAGSFGDLAFADLPNLSLLIEYTPRPSLSLGLGSRNLDAEVLEKYATQNFNNLNKGQIEEISKQLLSKKENMGEVNSQLLKALGNDNFTTWEGNEKSPLKVYFNENLMEKIEALSQQGYPIAYSMPDRLDQLKTYTFLYQSKVALKFLSEAIILRTKGYF